jgi:hypothetical protein
MCAYYGAPGRDILNPALAQIQSTQHIHLLLHIHIDQYPGVCSSIMIVCPSGVHEHVVIQNEFEPVYIVDSNSLDSAGMDPGLVEGLLNYGVFHQFTKPTGYLIVIC